MIGIVWNGIGVVSLYLIFIIVRKTWRRFRGEKKSIIMSTVFIGVIAGIIGVLLSFYAALNIDRFVRHNNGNDIVDSILMISVFLFTVLGAFSIGCAAEKFLSRLCLKRSTTYISIIVGLYLNAQEMLYWWITSAWSALMG